MKLSEAMRLGAMNGHQISYRLFDEQGGSCALGAVMFSSGAAHSLADIRKLDSIGADPREEIKKLFPILREWPTIVPDGLTRETIGRRYKPTLFEVIIYLNNECGWSREQISDYIEKLETLEPQAVESSKCDELRSEKEYAHAG